MSNLVQQRLVAAALWLGVVLSAVGAALAIRS
jgi:hypothetical protein